MTTDARLKDESRRRLQWLIVFRALFALFLLGSTLFFTKTKNFHYAEDSLLLLYIVSISTLVLSAGYAILLPFVKRESLFTYLQICIDTFAVTLIVYITGCFYSAFTFLYLIVIISACFFLFRKGGMIIAALSSTQYGIMIYLEYRGFITPADIDFIVTNATYSGPNVLYKTVIMMIACFAVAFLTSLLVEQERKARGELLVMRKYVKRVEKMAAVGEMAAGLAHEIKNPLAALTGAIEMLEGDGITGNPDDARLMKIIQREAKRLNSLVTNFLLFAKPHKGNIKKIPLDKILSETLDLFETGLKHKGDIQCVTHIAEGLWVDMDPEYLRQILWNLLLNAADAINETENQTGTITVNLHPVKNRMVRLEIIDDGCGMSAELLDVIFDPFFTTKSKGTGLGLSVVHRLVESYGGRLDFESEPGKGTKFVLYLTRTDQPS
jgi:two-component system sensor histidine kinase PilS (NtrC family)